MSEENNSLELLRIYELKEKATAKYLKENRLAKVSIESSQVSNSNNIDIVILRDEKYKILAHYQVHEDGSLFKIGNDQDSGV